MTKYIETLTNKSVVAMYTATLIAILEFCAIQQGMNGTVLSFSLSTIAGLGVYSYMGRKVEEAKRDGKEQPLSI